MTFDTWWHPFMPNEPADESFLTLNHILRPLGYGASAELRQALIVLRLDDEAQGRFDELASKNTNGTLDQKERQQLQDFVALNRFVSTLKAEALFAQQRSATA
jgi:hypothetical protein